MNLITIDEDEDTNKLGYDDPIDEEMSPLTNEQTAKVSLDNLTSPDPIQNLRQLYTNVSSLNIPKSWPLSIDFGQVSMNLKSELGRDVQLIVYRESISLLTPVIKLNSYGIYGKYGKYGKKTVIRKLRPELNHIILYHYAGKSVTIVIFMEIYNFNGQ
ncbi:hypothetical protein RhiirB3_471769 [Rhizophagus irregularis]|nr:hypothetical protein RhiirB3_471769 [Rhizophagus irregularis]